MVPYLLAAEVDKRVIVPQKISETWHYQGIGSVSADTLIHDVSNCCWHIFTGTGSLLYATDTGTLDGIKAEGYNLYLIEANHRQAEIAARIEDKLARGEFAYEYRAAQNHLSYEQAMEWLSKNAGPNSRYELLHQHKAVQQCQTG